MIPHNPLEDNRSAVLAARQFVRERSGVDWIASQRASNTAGHLRDASCVGKSAADGRQKRHFVAVIQAFTQADKFAITRKKGAGTVLLQGWEQMRIPLEEARHIPAGV